MEEREFAREEISNLQLSTPIDTGFGELAANWGKRQEHAVLEGKGLGGSSGKGIAGQSLSAGS